ncbi:hypothetical protein L3X38_038790 [Prunus dulcis]|uniref:Uncharacterized protein n=1 Tax=Prunus dulcis TaxID=3755 RepID=A0AAD4V822_PRUDU|nr:hypothetical protein L3X38_038790 [Prunus dulcis]
MAEGMPKEKTDMHFTHPLSSLIGQELGEFGEHELSQFNSETAAGVYNIDVKLALWVRARYGKFKTADYGSSKIDCKLKVPLSFSETPATGFNTTKCCNVYVLTNP